MNLSPDKYTMHIKNCITLHNVGIDIEIISLDASQGDVIEEMHRVQAIENKSKTVEQENDFVFAKSKSKTKIKF